MNYSHQLKHYIKYRIKAGNEHSMHSPFVFDLAIKVLYDKAPFYCFDNIEALREVLLSIDNTIEVTDFGAGSAVHKSNKRKISDIVKHSAKKEKYGQLLFKLVNYFQSKTILELGTSVGISTLYLASPNSKAKVITIEGCPQIAKVAQTNFDKLKIKSIDMRVGRFDDVLPSVLKEEAQLDFVFIDGHHLKQPTIKYFEMVLKNLHNNSVLVVDDIYWSEQMTEAWEYIKQHPSVTVTLDMFYLGIVFFRKEQVKEHFIVKY